MCITLTLHDLGPADALLDLEEGLLVLRPACSPIARLDAARCLLTRAGIPQTRPDEAVCRCGEVLISAEGASKALSLATAAVVALLAWLLVAVWPLIFTEPAVAEPPARPHTAFQPASLE